MPRASHKLKKTAKKDNSALEIAMLFVGAVEPLMTLPQIIDLFENPGNGRVSVLTWVFYLVAAVMWFVYGLYRQNKPLVVTGALWMIMDALVIIGIYYHP